MTLPAIAFCCILAGLILQITYFFKKAPLISKINSGFLGSAALLLLAAFVLFMRRHVYS